MNSLEATIRNTKTKGEVNSLRIKGNIPGIIYGGSEKNQKISLNKNKIKPFLNKENFLSNIVSINIDGKNENVLPREVTFDTVTDEPTHIDFLRIVKGAKIVLEIPVRFINNDKCPGLKRGGVLNVVRRKIELRCPTENIPEELIVDLENVDIGRSFKISSIQLPENVTPTIQGRDFVVATVAAPTIIKEPEKPVEAEEGAEGAEGTEDTAEGAEGTAEGAEKEVKTAEVDKGDKKEGDKKDTKKKEDKKTRPEKK